MKHFKIAEDLVLPLDVVTEKLAFLGRTGSGKTYAAMKLAELMLGAGAQVGALDPVGVWRALRVPATKDGQAFEVVVFGGLYGDVPLEPGAGKLIADLVVDRGLSFVVDVSQFIPAEQQTFAHDFAHQFFHRKKSRPSAVHLFLEECQEFIPENPSGREAMTLGQFQRLWKLGRNFGIGGSLISQRPQEIAKKALNMSGTLFAFQMTGPQERKAIKSWVADQGIATDIESVLQKLETGQPHVESPTFLNVSRTVRILPRVTADLSSTPKVGESTAAKRPLTPIDVEQLRSSMAATIEKAKAEDPRELRKLLADKDKRIKELEKVTSGFSPSKEGKKQEVPALTDSDRDLLTRLAAAIRDAEAIFAGEGPNSIAVLQSIAETAVVNALSTLRSTLTESVLERTAAVGELFNRARLRNILEKLDRVTAVPPATRVTIHPRDVKPATREALVNVARTVAAAPSTNGHAGAAGELAPAERKLVRVLAGAGGALTRRALAIRSGYSVGGGRFRNTLSAVKTAGFIATESDQVQLIAAVDDALPMSADDIQRTWQAKLSPAEWRLLIPLLSVFPQSLSRAELAHSADYDAAGGGFRNTLSVLSTNALITKTGGYVRAAEELFG